MITSEKIQNAKLKKPSFGHINDDNNNDNNDNDNVNIINTNITHSNRIVLSNKDIIELEDYNYHIIEQIGRGSFSNVYEANKYIKINHGYEKGEKGEEENGEEDKLGQVKTKVICNNRELALKFYKNNKIFQKSAITELNFLIHLKNNNIENNIIQYIDYFSLNSHICIVFEKYDMDLYKYYSKYIKPSKIKKENYSFLLKSITLGLSYLKNKNIINTDLKPENIFVNLDKSKFAHKNKEYPFKNIVISDFSSAIKMNIPVKYYNLTSLWYRAPEIYFKIKNLNFIDIWSFGCILYELWYSEPLFCLHEPNYEKNNISLQNNHILKIGYMPKDFLKSNYIKDELIVKPRFFHSHKQSKYYKTKFDSIPYPEIIRKILVWEPTKRITPEEILRIIDAYR